MAFFSIKYRQFQTKKHGFLTWFSGAKINPETLLNAAIPAMMKRVKQIEQTLMI